MKTQAMYNSDILAQQKQTRQDRIFKVLSVPLVLAICTVDSWVNWLFM